LPGIVDKPTSFAGLDGTLDMSGPDLAKLYPILGIATPPTPSYHLKGKIAYADRVVRVTDFSGTLGSGDLNGTVSVDVKGDKPRLNGNLTSRRVVIADLAGFIGSTPGKPEEAQAGDKVLPTRRIDVEKLNAMNARVTYRGMRIESEYVPVDNLRADLTLESGRLRLQPLDFGVGKGAMESKVDIDGHANPPHVSVDTDFRQLDLQRIMQQTKMFEGFGTFGGHAAVTSNGSSVAEIMVRGDGGITLAMAGSEISAADETRRAPSGRGARHRDHRQECQVPDPLHGRR
jgi:uncharacterized protein involved in outer membrane biogenesis